MTPINSVSGGHRMKGLKTLGAWALAKAPSFLTGVQNDIARKAIPPPMIHDLANQPTKVWWIVIVIVIVIGKVVFTTFFGHHH